MNGNWTLRGTAVVVFLIGLPMVLLGAGLTLAGGTPYYLVAGILMSLAAVELWRARRNAFYLFAATLFVTLAWSVYEAGFSFWHVGSRIWLVGLLMLWISAPWVRRPLWADTEDPGFWGLRTAQAGVVASALVLAGMTMNVLSHDVADISPVTGAPSGNPSDWAAYGGNNAGTRYAPHAGLDVDNVVGLTEAWRANTRRGGRFSGTPIQIEDGLYLCTAQNVVIALDVDSGEERWRFDPGNETPAFGIFGNCRGVTHYRLPNRPRGERCADRIYTATTDARMIALDMASGEPCDDFGDGGEISLTVGMGEVKPLYYAVTSPPTVASGSLAVGGLVLDNQETEEPSGVVRGYDAETGALVWAWDIGRVGAPALPAEGETYTRGTPNVWSLTASDDDLGLVYVPTGNATPDYFGGHRTEVMDEYASSIVAIDARTGETRWHFQTAHHDIWDYDVPSQPTLIDLDVDGRQRKAVIVPTKRGELFFLDRETGEPIAEVTERTVPQTDLEHEYTTPTQPFSTGMPSFADPDFGEKDLFGLTPYDQIACRRALRDLRWEGLMTPPSIGGTLLYPGPGGGMNWGSVAVDEVHKILVVNVLQMPFVIHMLARAEVEASTDGDFNPRYGIGGPQRGTPWAASVQMFSSPFGIPCIEPPYGEIAAIDLTTRQMIWRRPVGGTAFGFPSAAGSVVTAGGLVFNAGADGFLRAFETQTGEVIWQGQLPGGAGATPMSYVSPTTGRQYVIATVPGAGGGGLGGGNTPAADAEPGGWVVAFALPE